MVTSLFLLTALLFFFCLLIPWHGAGLVQAKSAGFGFPEPGSPLFVKCTRVSLGDAGA